MFTFYCQTFGCKVSQYETQSQREAWLAQGATEVETPLEADVLLLATCAVTAEAVSDARQASKKYMQEYPHARQIITGCAATAAQADFALREEDSLVPQTERHILLQHHPTQHPPLRPQSAPLPLAYPPFCVTNFKRTRAVLKVQDGCSHKCSYCIVPLTRGHARSRPVQACIEEAQALLAAGHREIILSGINLRQYHHDKQDFWDLIQALDNALAPKWAHGPQKARLRISSLDPAQLTHKGLDTLAASRMLCPHLHLSLQSGSSSVLARMGRTHYSPEFLLAKAARVQKFWPTFALGADILMGFPGETQAEVAETLSLVEKLPLTYAHVFPFSARPGTKAATLSGQLPKKQKQEHALLVREKVELKQKDFLQKICAFPQLLLVPTPDKHGECQTGLSEYYTECHLENAYTHANPLLTMQLTPMQPLRMENMTLICAPITAMS